MKIKFEYKTDTPTFEYNTVKDAVSDSPVFCLTVEGTSGRSRKEALTDYLVNIEHYFRDLDNQYDTDIQNVDISGSFFDSYLASLKEGQNSNGLEGISKYDFTIFSFFSDVFNEKILFAKNNTESKGNINFSYEEIGVNQNLGKTLKNKREFFGSLAVYIHNCLPNYSLRYNYEEGRMEYIYKGTILKSIEDIKADDEFIFFKFVEVALANQLKYAIIFIDASLFKPEILNALIGFIRLYYKNQRMVYVYNFENKKNKLNLNQELVVLPNHKLNMMTKEKLANKKK